MQCGTCRYTNHQNAMICGNCGAPLHPSIQVAVADALPKKAIVQKLLKFLSRVETEKLDQTHVTQKLNIRALLQEELDSAPEPVVPTDITHFPAGASILLQFRDDKVMVDAPRSEVVLGRFGDTIGVPREVYPVNLSEYAGYAMGVSRIHASLRPTADQRLEIMDLASSNGTFLNGSPLNPYESYDVYHGDELMLGQLRIIINFVYHKQAP